MVNIPLLLNHYLVGSFLVALTSFWKKDFILLTLPGWWCVLKENSSSKRVLSNVPNGVAGWRWGVGRNDLGLEVLSLLQYAVLYLRARKN